MQYNRNQIQTIFLCVLCTAWLFGCAPLNVNEAFEKQGWSVDEAKSIDNVLSQHNLFAQIALAALSTRENQKGNTAFVKSYSCIFGDSSQLPKNWDDMITEIEKQHIADHMLPLDGDQRKEALELLREGKAGRDIKDSLGGIFSILAHLQSSGAKDIVNSLLNPAHASVVFDAFKKDVQLRINNGSDRKHMLNNTLEAVYSNPIGSAVSDTVNIFINKKNRTMRLAIIAYARLNGINITEENLDDLATALDKDNPDFYPLLAGAVDTLKKEYGITELTAKLNEIKKSDHECSAPRHGTSDSSTQLNLIPVLYVPGLGDSGASVEQWKELKELFKQGGYSLKAAVIPSSGTIENGASALFSEVERLFPKERFHIVAKSMGGLSTRLMLHDHLMADRVISVTTISTPHLGSEVADFYTEGHACTLPGELILPIADKIGIGKNGFGEAGKQLTTKYIRGTFNKNVPYDPSIPFYSFGYKIDCNGLFCNEFSFYPVNPLSACWHNQITKRAGEENDGLVSIKSAQWGTYVGTYEGEHLAETSKPFEVVGLPIMPLYKNKPIWQDVFQRVIDNLNKQH